MTFDGVLFGAVTVGCRKNEADHCDQQARHRLPLHPILRETTMILRNVSQIDQLLNGNSLGFGIFLGGSIEYDFHLY
jgi:hypothetical protein